MLVGLTGGIGSGKSTLAKALREQGYAVYDCDREAKRILIEDKDVRQQMEALLGKEVYEGGVYQTQAVAAQVFAHPELLQQVNAIVHPAVKEDVLKWAQNQDKCCFVESAILYQSGLDNICDRVVGVIAPLELRIARTMQRDGANDEQVRRRIHAQISDEILRTRAHVIVNNDGSERVDTLVKQMLRDLL